MLYIKQKLYERQEPKELVEEFLNTSPQPSPLKGEGVDQSLFEDDISYSWEMENLKKEYEKLKGKFENRKIMEKLVRKGFKYDDVKDLF
jgi:SOS response regulatory protein OraA/RecX